MYLVKIHEDVDHQTGNCVGNEWNKEKDGRG
jgi:hypothetical protein